MAQRIIAAPTTSLGLDPALRTTIKGFEKIALQTANSINDIVPLFYKPKTFSERTIAYPVYTGIPDATTWDGKQLITSVDMEYLYDVTATQYIYANAIEYTWEADLWDIYNVNPKKAAELGKSLRVKRNRVGMDFWSSAFTTNWYDGVPFFSASHPQALGTPGSATQSNLVTGALSPTTLVTGLNALIDMRDPFGRPVNEGITSFTLFVDPTKVINARSVLNDGLKLAAGTANNDRNPFSEFTINIKGVPYGWTSTRWVLQASNFQSFYSDKVPIKMLPAKATDAHGVKQDGAFVCAFWAEDYRQYVGSTGL